MSLRLIVDFLPHGVNSNPGRRTISRICVKDVVQRGGFSMEKEWAVQSCVEREKKGNHVKEDIKQLTYRVRSCWRLVANDNDG